MRRRAVLPEHCLIEEPVKARAESKTILIADDDDQVLSVLRELFESNGYRVIVASNGEEAVEAVQGDLIDVAVLDMRMPRMSGLEALKKIKRFDRSIEVLIITGYTDIDNFVEAIRKEGASDYILKPFRLHEVLHAVQSSIRKRDALLTHGDPHHRFREFAIHAEESIAERTAALRESQIKYKQIIESSTDGIVIVRSGRFSFVNPQVMEKSGFTQDEILEMRAMDLVHPEDRRMLRGFCKRTLEGAEGDPSAHSFRVLKKNGVPIWVEINAISTLWEGSQATMAFVRDISERKRAEEMLRKAHEELEQKVKDRTAELLETNTRLKKEIDERKQAEKQIEKSKSILQGVFDGISDPLIMLGRNMTIKALNKAASAYFEVAYQDAIDKPYRRLLEGTSAKGRQRDIPRAVMDGQSRIFEREGLKDPDRLERVFVYPLKRGFAKNTGVLIRISDITEEKMMEKRLSQSEKLASLGLLVSGIAHEINNPNNFIFFNVPILRNYLQEVFPVIDAYAKSNPGYEILGMSYEEFHQDLWKLLDNMEHGATRINSTVSSLSEFSRLRDKESHQRINLKQLIENAVAICHGQITKMVNAFELEIPEGLPQVNTEPGSLEQVLINLLINAAQAANKKRSWVRLKVQWVDSTMDQVIIEVSDNGCGMSEEIKERIFEPFFTTKSAGAGTGLGLYICHNLIEGLGGHIEVESVLGKGSKFRVVLPNVVAGKAPRG
jgi:PAS domain S-box-containing protein